MKAYGTNPKHWREGKIKQHIRIFDLIAKAHSSN